MKTYENESLFVNNFAKDAKESLKNGQNFEAVINGITVVVTGMDNNNSSKVTMYTGSVNGIAFLGSITALKKKVNVTYKKEYNRSSEPSTKIVIKSDEELEKTAEIATERYKRALSIVLDYSKRYFSSYPVNMLEGLNLIVVGDESVPTLDEEHTQDIILSVLKEWRDEEQRRREDEAKKKAEESAKKLASEKEKLEKQLAELQAKLAKMG